nr:4-hydroxy-3-methylbut-2-enyl diphosphate reductase [Spirochaetota bacterium]
MKIELARHSGFCMGVRDAILTIVEELNTTSEEILVYGPLIHNPQTVSILGRRGLKTIHDLNDIDGKTIAVRTHGIPIEKLRDIKARSRRYLNLTCPRVS